MKKQNLSLLINAVILVLISAVFLFIYATQVPKDLDDKLFGQVVTLGEARVITNEPPFGHYTIVHTAQDAFNNQGQKLGVVYNVKSKYNYFNPNDPGYIELLVAVDNQQKITVQIVSLKQTETYTAGLQNYVFEYFQGFGLDQIILIPILNLEEPDAGATASASTGKIKELVTMVIQYHTSLNSSLSEVNIG
jgi:hypothetical protein